MRSHVRSRPLVVEPLPSRRRGGLVGERADRVDPRGDPGVGGRHDLGAVAEVDLVAVVLRRVVRRGDHDAGDAAEVTDRVGEHRCRERPGQQQGAQPRTRHDLGGVTGEHVGVVARVVTDHDRVALAGAVVAQVRREAGCRAGDHDPVHPVRPRAQGAAQPRRTELESARRTGPRGPRRPSPDGSCSTLRTISSSSAEVWGSGSSAVHALARSRRSAMPFDAVVMP